MLCRFYFTVILLTEVWHSCCAVRELGLSDEKGRFVKFKAVSSTQGTIIVSTETLLFQGLTTCLSRIEDCGIRLW